jgi:hypothetical protein
MDDGSLLGESRLQEVASRCCGAPATTIAATLHDAAMSSVADQDDVAILVIAAH